MSEFKYANDGLLNKRRDFHLRVALWSMVAAALGVGMFALYGKRVADSNMNVTLTVLTVLILAVIIILAFILAFRHAEEVARHESTVVLTDDTLIYKRSGRPDVQIGFSEISDLYMRGSRLIVEVAVPPKRIMIPQDIPELRTVSESLAKHHSIVTQPTTGVPMLAKPIIYAVCCSLVLWTRLNMVMLIAAAVGLVIVGLESFYLFAKIKQNPRRRLSIAILICEWLGVVMIAYFRIVRS
jgi:hypothetical protein